MLNKLDGGDEASAGVRRVKSTEGVPHHITVSVQFWSAHESVMQCACPVISIRTARVDSNTVAIACSQENLAVQGAIGKTVDFRGSRWGHDLFRYLGSALAEGKHISRVA